jgi:hypothetical protein
LLDSQFYLNQVLFQKDFFLKSVLFNEREVTDKYEFKP